MTAPRLPLAIDSGPFGRDRAVLDADGRQLAFIACHSRSTARTAEEGQQIAATIVRAVNAHAQLLDALTLALPYVECAADDPTYKPGAVARMAATMRAAIEAAEAPQ